MLDNFLTAFAITGGVVSALLCIAVVVLVSIYVATKIKEINDMGWRNWLGW